MADTNTLTSTFAPSSAKKAPLTALVPAEAGHRTAHRALRSTWSFRLLYAAGLALTLPMVSASRLLPGRWHSDENVFVEANRAVLTALGFAFMA